MVDGPNAAKGQEYRRFWTFRSTTPGRVDIVAMPGRSCEVPTQHNWKHIAIMIHSGLNPELGIKMFSYCHTNMNI